MADYKLVDYNKLDTDLASVANAIRKRAGTSAKLEFPSGFENAVKNIPWGGEELPKLTNPASASDLSKNKQMINQDGNKVNGTLPDGGKLSLAGGKLYGYVFNNGDRGVQTAASADEDRIIRAGDEVGVIATYDQFGDALDTEVAAGKTFTSVAGLRAVGKHVCKGGIDTSDATATAGDIRENFTAYVNGVKVTGTIKSQSAQTITPGTEDKSIPAGKYLSGTQTIKGDGNLKPENIKKGVSIFGVDGSHECEEGVTLPDLRNPGTASDMALGKELIDQNGNKVTGTLKGGGGLRLTGGTAYDYIGDGTGVILEASMDVDRIFREGDNVGVVATYDKFGNATAADVAKGKTFTSAAGWLVKGEHECEGGVELPELGDTAAKPTDIAAGKVLYDDDGNPVTGELDEVLEGRTIAARKFRDLSKNGDNIETRAVMNIADVVVRKNAMFRTYAPASAFGNATADQVAKGATFTSVAGLLVEGTHECEGVELPDGAIAVQIVKGEQASTQVGSGYSLSISYADSVEINDSIALAFVGTAKSLSNISSTTDFSNLMGKYVRAGSSYGSTGSFYYIPDGATFTVGGQSMNQTLTCDKAQLVSLQKVIV